MSRSSLSSFRLARTDKPTVPLSLAPALSIETFLTDPATHRADETIVGQMSEVDGTVVTQDISMTWVLEDELGEDQVVQLTVPLLEVTNLARTHAGYSSATINIPEAFVSVYALGAPEGAVVASIDGVRIEDARWARWPAPMDHPHQPGHAVRALPRLVGEPVVCFSSRWRGLLGRHRPAGATVCPPRRRRHRAPGERPAEAGHRPTRTDRRSEDGARTVWRTAVARLFVLSRRWRGRRREPSPTC